MDNTKNKTLEQRRKEKIFPKKSIDESIERKKVSPKKTAVIEEKKPKAETVMELITDSILAASMPAQAPLDQFADELIDNAIGKEQSRERFEILEKIPSGDVLDVLTFVNGKNTLKIKFIRTPNRVYRIQVFMNDSQEVRPSTFAGASPGWSFWKLFKRLMVE